MKTHHALCGLLSGLLLLAAGTAQTHATPIVVGNFSFESLALADGDFTSARLGDFQINAILIPFYSVSLNVGFALSDAGVFNPTAAHGYPGTTGSPGTLPGTGDGAQFAFINSGAAIYQDVGLLQPSTVYTLTIASGNRTTNDGSSSGSISLVNGTSDTGTVLSSLAITPPTGTFADFTTTFTTGASVVGDLTIVLNSTSSATAQINFDNVRLDATPAPEPTSAALLLGSGAMLMLRRRRAAAL